MYRLYVKILPVWKPKSSQISPTGPLKIFDILTASAALRPASNILSVIRVVNWTHWSWVIPTSRQRWQRRWPSFMGWECPSTRSPSGSLGPWKSEYFIFTLTRLWLAFIVLHHITSSSHFYGCLTLTWNVLHHFDESPFVQKKHLWNNTVIQSGTWK